VIPIRARHFLPSATRRPLAGRRSPRLAPALAGLLVLVATGRAAAHGAGPAQTVSRQAAGPYLVSVWTDPDVGDGQVLVQVHEPVGARPEVRVVAVPVDGHLGDPLEVSARQSDGSGGISVDTWVASVPFDATGAWSVRVELAGPEGSGSVLTTLEALPAEGPVGWEVALFVLPFALLGLALGWGWWSHRNEQAELVPPSDPGPSAG
jgi:hypothetical protein